MVHRLARGGPELPEASVSVIVPGARFTGIGSRRPPAIDFPCTSEPGQSTSAFGFSATNFSGTLVSE